MKNLVLENYGADTLSFDEMLCIDGGGMPWSKVVKYGKAALEWAGVIDALDDAAQGLSDGWNGVHK